MLLTAQGAANLLGTSERQVYRWVDDGEIPCRRVRDQLRFNPTDLLEWATVRRLPVHVEAFEAEDAAEHAPGLAAAMHAGGLHSTIGGTDRESTVRAVFEAIALPEIVDRALLVDVLLARESAGCTAIGDGVAIPHPRNPIIAPAARPTVAVCYLTNAIPFGARDGQPVRTLFVAVTPTVRVHLRLLARLARALADGRFRAAVDRRASLATLVGEAERLETEAPHLVGEPEATE